jgi:hypothetical protein
MHIAILSSDILCFVNEIVLTLKNVNRTQSSRLLMNEIKLVFFGLMALLTTAIFFWIFDEPEIIEDKEVEITIGLGIALLILIIDKRADRHLHDMIYHQHELIDTMHKTIQEQHELIKNIHMESNQKGSN